MNATVLVDNEATGSCSSEWGLSVLIEENGMKVLLDTGATGMFAENAEILKIDLREVDAAVLSHAHFDHSGGFDEFFAINSKAKLYMHESASEDCYSQKPEGLEYIGIPLGVLERHRQRIERVSETRKIADGFWILPHSTPELSKVGKAAGMLRRKAGGGGEPTEEDMVPDDFSHEVSLVVELAGGGIAVFSSCSHAGADVVVREAQKAWPQERIRAVVGGFHLYQTPEPQVREFARRLKETGVELVCTGHCTGAEALRVLTEELGQDVVRPTAAGLTIEL